MGMSRENDMGHVKISDKIHQKGVGRGAEN